MARFNIYKVNNKTGMANWLQKQLTASDTNDYVMFERTRLKANESLIIEDGNGDVDMEFTKDSVITPKTPNRVSGSSAKGFVYVRTTKSNYNQYNNMKRKPTKSKMKTSSSSKNTYSRMWRMKSKQIYAWLKNPKNGTRKDRRMASYILSTRRRK